MLTFVLTDIGGEKEVFRSAKYVEWNQEENVPADDLTAVFSYRRTNELSDIEVFCGTEPVFRGIVDEQRAVFSGSSAQLMICARSLAALLLDNEAEPVTYAHPSAGIIYERHAKDYGITLMDDAKVSFCSDLVVTKGMSDWQVLRDFAAGCCGAMPRVSGVGGLYLRGLSDDGEVLFSNERGIGYSRIEENLKRAEELSGVNIKVINAAGYDNRIENPSASRRGIRRERYLNAIITDAPMQCADRMIRNSRRDAYSVELRCTGLYTDLLGKRASVESTALGAMTALYVCSTRCVIGSSGSYTDVVLKRRDV